MKQLFSKVPTYGLTYFDRNSATPDDGYTIRSNYVLVELHRGDWFLNYYIVPSKEGTCILLGYIPELSLVEQLKNNKIKLLKLMQHSSLFAKVLKDSLAHKSHNLFNFTTVKDFVEGGGSAHCWCVKYTSDIAYNQNIFNETLPESHLIGQILSDICMLADDFYGVYNTYNLDPRNKEWLQTSKMAAISNYAYKIHEDKMCSFGNALNTDDLPIKVKDLLMKEGYILLTSTGIAYPFDVEVRSEDIGNSTLLIRADLFFPNLKKDQFAYFIHLELKDGKWQASIDLQWLAELVDKALNHVDTRKTKMTALSYKYFPVSSHIWVNSIATPRYKKFKEYIDEVLKTDKQIIDRPFNDNGYKNFVKKGTRIICVSPLSINFTNRPWNIPSAVSDLIFYGIIINYEVYNIVKNEAALEKEAKQRKSQQWLELSGNILKIVSKISRFS